MLYDTHAHLDHSRLYPDLPAVMERAAAAGVSRVNCVGCDWPSSLMSVRLAEKYAVGPVRVYAAVGVHPHDANTLDEAMLERLVDLAQAEAVVAWGEIGLDYYRDLSPRPVQQRAFAQQLAAAEALGLPVIIHDRDAHHDILEQLKAARPSAGGVMHCFSGSWEMARDCLDLGFYISLAGPLTYANARSLPEVAKKLPLDRVLVETDCPYLSPEPFRGQTNEPAHVSRVLACLALLRGLDYEEMAARTTENACRLFHIA